MITAYIVLINFLRRINNSIVFITTVNYEVTPEILFFDKYYNIIAKSREI
jgi:hypothetical protein